MKHGSLFSGIGGFDLAAQWMGWENVFHCEFNPFGKQVLQHYWPDAISYDDITQTDFTKHYGTVDVISGGFPCQPFSTAGKRKGTADSRHLWPEMLRAIREIAPAYVVGENVRGLINWNGGMVFDQVLSDLENEGYQVAPLLLPAAAVNAPHRRDRIWFIAYRYEQQQGNNQRKNIETATKIWREKKSHVSGELCCNGPTTNTNKIRLQHSKKAKHFFISTAKAQIKGSKFAKSIETNGSNGNVTNTQIQSSRRELQQQQEQGQFGGCNSQSNVTNTDVQRCKKSNTTNFAKKQTRQYSQKDIITKSKCWTNFPTQSPVCSRNDGIPTKLSGITVSKHRNESIKAYGNAIVPQVAYQIFQAIEITEQKMKHETQKNKNTPDNK